MVSQNLPSTVTLLLNYLTTISSINNFIDI